MILFLIFPWIQGCVNNGVNVDDQHPETLPRSLTAGEEELIRTGHTFSFDLFRKVTATEKEDNVFISPFSVSMALGMMLNGAEGATLSGIKETVDMTEMELQAINQSYQSLTELLLDLDPKVEIQIANSLWGREGFTIAPDFYETLQTYFSARVASLDFSKASSADIINDWVCAETNDRIPAIIDGSIPSEVVLYLINTTYFKGNWLYRFDPEDTKPGQFQLEDGSSVQVEMMRQNAPIATFRSEIVQMAEMAYGDSLYQMTILMPSDPDVPITRFAEESLSASNLAGWTEQLQKTKLQLKMPKFESSYKKNLNDVLATMGMEEAFDEVDANFSKINADKQLFISKVMHKANITVDEKGSEAAAATSVGIGVTSVQKPSFVVDRPFIYLIRERISGTVLFMGMMRNPSK
ncbi:serpin family protein [Fodinibius sediminis]|uniref:serpin family protein n=1 Tax=Fodinibius sediminis TaxID=1214077 RepID=UPI00163DABD7|nr:serpin family protein [Fodinibius sediminis]